VARESGGVTWREKRERVVSANARGKTGPCVLACG